MGGGRLTQFTPFKLIRVLQRLGFVIKRQTGSHIILRHPISKRMVVIPYHARELKRGLLLGIIKQAGLVPDDLMNL